MHCKIQFYNERKEIFATQNAFTNFASFFSKKMRGEAYIRLKVKN